MNRTVIWAIARKDMGMITSSTQIWLPMLILPLLLGVIVPGVLIFALKGSDLAAVKGINAILSTLEKLPAGGLREMLASMPTIHHKLIYLVTNYTFAPIFLLIPVMSCSLVAANSFVGEKERRTLESLLFAPVTVKELFVAKVLAAFIPAMALTLVTILLYGAVVDTLTYSMFGGLIFPNWSWLVLLLWVVPAISLCTILVSVLISARVKGFQEAQQLAGLIVLPVMALVISQATGLLFVTPIVMGMIGALLFAICAAILPKIAKLNDRELLFARQVH
jgi:ABC-2 type transport system permease protein